MDHPVKICPNIIIHYLDDFLIVAKNNVPIATQALNETIALFNWLHIPIAPGKLEGPTTSLTYLGILINTATMSISLPADKLSKLTARLAEWRIGRKCTKRELLSLVGQLSFATKVVRSGRTFLRRLIDLSKTAKKLHHHITLNAETRQDITWWQTFLPKWNGHSIIYDSQTTKSSDIHLFSDASNIGYGVYYAPKWLAERWPDYIHDNPLIYNINFRELFAIHAAVATFSKTGTGPA